MIVNTATLGILPPTASHDITVVLFLLHHFTSVRSLWVPLSISQALWEVVAKKKQGIYNSLSVCILPNTNTAEFCWNLY